MGDEVNN